MSDVTGLFDLQTLSIWATVVAVSAATIYAIMNALMKEKSYEDVVLEQTGKVVKHTSKPIPKKSKKNKQAKQQQAVKRTEVVNAKSNSAGDNEIETEKPVANSIQPVQADKAKVNNKSKKRSDKEMASGKGLTSVALQIHDLIQELLLTENDTELLVDELTRFSPNLREKYTKSSKPNKKNENKQNEQEKDNIVQLKKEIEIEKQNIRISDKLVETLSFQIKSLSQTSETNKKINQSLKNEIESFKSKDKIPDQRDIVKKLNSEINDINKQLDQQKAKTQGIDVGNMKKQLEIITGELTKSALKMNAAENGKKIFEKKAINLQKRIETLESSLAQNNDVKVKDSESLLNEINTLRAKCHEVETQLSDSLSVQVTNKQEYNRVHSQYDNIVKENKHKTTLLEDLMTEKCRIDTELTNLQKNFTSNLLLWQNSDGELKSSHMNIEKLNTELSEQRNKNDVLRSRNSSVVDSFTAIEKENVLLKSDLQKSQVESKSSNVIEQEILKLRKVYDETVSSNKVEIKKLSSQIENLDANSKTFEKKTQELINSEDKVKNELLLLKEKYLTTIKVNQELKKLTESTDNTNLENTINEISLKNEKLESAITGLNEEKKKLKDELNLNTTSNDTISNELANYKKVLNNTEAVLQKLQNSVENEEKIWKDKLEKEKSINTDQIKNLEKDIKSVHSENVKLNGVIKTGKDALDAEQKITEDLKEKAKKSGSSNGLTEDHAKTKKRLAIVESLLENERSNNKVLSAKLGA